MQSINNYKTCINKQYINIHKINTVSGLDRQTGTHRADQMQTGEKTQDLLTVQGQYTKWQSAKAKVQKNVAEGWVQNQARVKTSKKESNGHKAIKNIRWTTDSAGAGRRRAGRWWRGSGSRHRATNKDNETLWKKWHKRFGAPESTHKGKTLEQQENTRLKHRAIQNYLVLPGSQRGAEGMTGHRCALLTKVERISPALCSAHQLYQDKHKRRKGKQRKERHKAQKTATQNPKPQR